MNGLESFPGAQSAGANAIHFGDVAAEASRVLNGTVIAPLVHSALIAARGAEADAFLQGQLSNDLRKLAPDQAQLASFNSPKGRMLAVLHLLRGGDAVFLELERSIREAVLQRLRMYVLRAKVTLAPDDDHALLGVAGPDAPMVLAEAGLAVPTAPLGAAWSGDTCTVRRLGARPRYSVQAPAADAAGIWARLAARAIPVGTQAWKLLEIEAGVPTVYPATQDHFVAQMCNLDALGGISFDKGCYTGQEVIARVHYRGAVKRHMTQMRLPGEVPGPGTKVDAGEVVDAAPHPEGGALALVVTGPQG